MKRDSGRAANSIASDRGDHRDEHDRHVLGHADRRDDAVDREHNVEQQDLADRGPAVNWTIGLAVLRSSCAWAT